MHPLFMFLLSAGHHLGFEMNSALVHGIHGIVGHFLLRWLFAS
jgi:hypothetical protein